MATVNKPNGKYKADEKVIDQPMGRAAPPIDPAEDPVARGRDAWRRRRNDASWQDWLLIGEALRIGRQEALEKAKTDKSVGKRYTVAFHDWLQLHGFDDIDKSDRAKLLQMMDQLADVEAFRATLTQAERLRLNHPCSVWRRYSCPRRQQKLVGYSCASRRKATATERPQEFDDAVEQEYEKAETDAWHGQLIQRAQQAAGAARSYADWSGDVDPGLLQEVRAAAEEWTKLADRLERLECEQHDTPSRLVKLVR